MAKELVDAVSKLRKIVALGSETSAIMQRITARIRSEVDAVEQTHRDLKFIKAMVDDERFRRKPITLPLEQGPEAQPESEQQSAARRQGLTIKSNQGGETC